ncbi:MAG: hypothetical protein PF486_06170, partial [Prolixibacteraceae bacterium]|nr:hypothetical protein [Prolixibacteraceae bacterium]
MINKIILIHLYIMANRYLLPEQIEHEDTTYPLFDDTVQKGGYRVCASQEVRNNITLRKRAIGTLVNIGGVVREYKGTDITNANWINQSNWQLIGTLSRQLVDSTSQVGAILTSGAFLNDLNTNTLYQITSDTVPTDTIDSLKSAGNIVVVNGNLPEITIGTSTIRYNTAQQVLEIVYPNGQTEQIGREGTTLVYSEDAILDGVPFYVTGAIQYDTGDGLINIVKVAPASNVNVAKSHVAGWTTMDIGTASIGVGTWKGDLHNQDTSGTVIGRTVYLGSNGWTDVPPSSPDLIVEIGHIIKVGTTDGIIQVHPPHFSNSSHTDLINQNEDPNFQHLPSDQVAKLGNIASNAEVNVNADWSSITGDSEILNKPTDLTNLATHNVTELSDITSAGSGSIITTVER